VLLSERRPPSIGALHSFRCLLAGALPLWVGFIPAIMHVWFCSALAGGRGHPPGWLNYRRLPRFVSPLGNPDRGRRPVAMGRVSAVRSRRVVGTPVPSTESTPTSGHPNWGTPEEIA